MVKVNGAYKHGMYEQILLNSLCVVSNIKDVAVHDSQPAWRTRLIT